MKKIILFSLIALSALSAACSKPAPQTPFKPTASLQEIMSAIIDPNIDYVWNSVSTVSTANGIEEKRPESDEAWRLIKQRALTVLEAGNLLLMEGRQIAAEGANTSSGGAELSSHDIQILIEAQHDEFVQRAHALQDAMRLVISAVDQKDAEALEKAGSNVEHACEQCHAQFWYPNDSRPK